MKHCLAFIIMLAAFAPAADAVEVKTVGDFRFLGGQYYYNTAPSSLSGNLSLTVVPAVKLSDSFSILPTCMVAYRGTKEVADLIGGGTLFQDSQNYLVSVKGVYAALPQLKIKPGFSYRREYLRESRNETWGTGLFDYAKINYGLEAEYAFVKRHALRVSYDRFTLAFPNYSSLESQQTRELGRELAGTRTLDSDNTLYRAVLADAFGPVQTELSYMVLQKEYPDQPLIRSNSSLSADRRSDRSATLAVQVGVPVKLMQGLGFVSQVNYQQTSLDSSQAHYDAQHGATFTPDYYDYSSSGLGASLNFLIGPKPWALTVAVNRDSRDYLRRRVQDAAGEYSADTADTIDVSETVAQVALVYPLTPEFKLRLISTLVDSSSNMKYESSYAYTYQTSNYLMGFSYEF